MSKPKAVLDRIEGQVYRDRGGIDRVTGATAYFREGEHSAPLPLGLNVLVTDVGGGYMLEMSNHTGRVIARHWAMVGWSTRDCLAGWLKLEGKP